MRPALFRTLFLSDLHLGAIGSRSDLILDFLKTHPADSYILVGDVLDLWHPLLPYWSLGDQAVVDYLNQRALEGAKLQYVRGNHDPNPTHAPDHVRIDAEFAESLIHVAGDARKYLVLHGDEVDSRLVRSHFATRLGSLIEHVFRRLDLSLRRLRNGTHGETRSIVEAILFSLNSLSYRGRVHERRLVALAHEAGLDGVICGHYHIAQLHEAHGLVYANCGDWVDSFTALAETEDGSLRLFGGRHLLDIRNSKDTKLAEA